MHWPPGSQARRHPAPAAPHDFVGAPGAFPSPRAAPPAVSVPADDRLTARSFGLPGDDDLKALRAETAQELSKVYENLGRSVAVDVQRQEVTDWFAAIAVLFLAAQRHRHHRLDHPLLDVGVGLGRPVQPGLERGFKAGLVGGQLQGAGAQGGVGHGGSLRQRSGRWHRQRRR